MPISFPSPAFCQLGGIYDLIGVPILNNFQDQITGIVFGVFHNSIGQTLEISTATETLGAGQNLTAYITMGPMQNGSVLPRGNYSIDIFVWTPIGVPLSPKQTVQLTCG